MKYFLSVLLMCFCATLSNAQISISIEDMSDVLTNLYKSKHCLYQEETDSFKSLEMQSGANQVWDFSSFNFLPLEETQLADPFSDYLIADTIFEQSSDVFLGQTHMIGYHSLDSDAMVPPLFGNIKLSENEYLFYGYSTNYIPFDTTIENNFFVRWKYDPPFLMYKLPFTYLDTWDSKGTLYEQDIDSNIQSLGEEDYTSTVDGYGVVLLAVKDSNLHTIIDTVQAIRVKTVDNSVFDTLAHHYEWFSKDGYIGGMWYAPTLNERYLTYLPHTKSTDSVTAGAKRVLRSLHSSVNNNTIDRPANNTKLSPNPTNASTMLSYTFPESAQTRILLMDALGQNVKVLFDGRANVGANDLRIDAKSLSNGTYFIQVTSNNFSAMQKLVVAK